jgi:hypothetical protein
MLHRNDAKPGPPCHLVFASTKAIVCTPKTTAGIKTALAVSSNHSSATIAPRAAFKDWNLAWENWVRNGVKFDKQRGANGVGPANTPMGGILRGLKRHLDRRP